MGVEIERKFLVDKELWDKVEKPKGLNFEQGYLLTQIDKTIRVRIADEKAYLTIKGKPDGFSHPEFEYEIPLDDGKEMMLLFTEEVITKTRYRITYAGKVWEVDDFAGANEGLLVAEIELNDRHEQFEIPEWIITEVTADERYHNSNLSKHPYSRW